MVNTFRAILRFMAGAGIAKPTPQNVDTRPNQGKPETPPGRGSWRDDPNKQAWNDAYIDACIAYTGKEHLR